MYKTIGQPTKRHGPNDQDGRAFLERQAYRPSGHVHQHPIYYTERASTLKKDLPDQKTREYIRAWGVQHVPTAEIVLGSFPLGTYPSMAILGWVEQRKVGWPVVGVRLSVLNDTRTQAIGSLSMALPLTPTSERHVCCFLQDLGWDGRVWPYQDHGWPEGTTDEEGMLKLLKRVKLGATMTFPANPEFGTPTVLVAVTKRKGSFSVAPFGEEVIPRHLDALRTLAANPTPFKSDWT